MGVMEEGCIWDVCYSSFWTSVRCCCCSSSCMLGSKQAHIEVNSNWAMSGSRTDLKNAVYAQQ